MNPDVVRSVATNEYLFDHPRREAQDRQHVDDVLRQKYVRHDGQRTPAHYRHEERLEHDVGGGEREVDQQHRAVAGAERPEQLREFRVQQSHAFRRHGRRRRRLATPHAVERAEPVAEAAQIETRRGRHREHGRLRRREQLVDHVAPLYERRRVQYRPEVHAETRVVRRVHGEHDEPERLAQRDQTDGARRRLRRVRRQQLTVELDHAVDKPETEY